MHRYVRAIGFSNKHEKKYQKKLMELCVSAANDRMYTIDEDEIMQAEFCRDFTEDTGLSACGTFNDDDQFEFDYLYPYLRTTKISSYDDIFVEQHASGLSYSGIVEDPRIGVNLIFHLRNRIQYIKAKTAGLLPIKGTSVSFSALSLEGTVLLPVHKTEEKVKQYQESNKKREQLLNDARAGNEEAYETLNMDDLDLYTTLGKKILKNDVFSLVDTYFMPYGVECEIYNVMGEIIEVHKQTNTLTGDQIYILTICANELTFDVAINIIDLLGVPEPGRRFKGIIWLQGYINFPS